MIFWIYFFIFSEQFAKRLQEEEDRRAASAIMQPEPAAAAAAVAAPAAVRSDNSDDSDRSRSRKKSVSIVSSWHHVISTPAIHLALCYWCDLQLAERGKEEGRKGGKQGEAGEREGWRGRQEGRQGGKQGEASRKGGRGKGNVRLQNLCPSSAPWFIQWSLRFCVYNRGNAEIYILLSF